MKYIYIFHLLFLSSNLLVSAVLQKHESGIVLRIFYLGNCIISKMQFTSEINVNCLTNMIALIDFMFK